MSCFTKAPKTYGVLLQNAHSGTLSKLTRLAGFWPRNASQTLPSTRAGGQDDVSSQANSLELTKSLDFLRTSFDFLKKNLDFLRKSVDFLRRNLDFLRERFDFQKINWNLVRKSLDFVRKTWIY